MRREEESRQRKRDETGDIQESLRSKDDADKRMTKGQC